MSESEVPIDNRQVAGSVEPAEWAPLLPWVAAKNLRTDVYVDPGSSPGWLATIIRWIARGQGLGFRHFGFILLCSILLEWFLLPASITFTCGVGALFLAPHLTAAFLALHLRLLYGTATNIGNLFDGFKCYVQLLVLALITFGLMVAFWLVAHIVLSMVMMSLIGRIWDWGAPGMFLVILLGVAPFVLVWGIPLLFFLLPSLMVFDRGTGPVDALRLTLGRFIRHLKLLVPYVVAISLLLGMYAAVGVALIAMSTIVSFLLGLVVLGLGYGHFLIAAPGWIVVVYESFFPPGEVIQLPNGRELTSLISPQRIQNREQPAAK